MYNIVRIIVNTNDNLKQTTYLLYMKKKEQNFNCFNKKYALPWLLEFLQEMPLKKT